MSVRVPARHFVYEMRAADGTVLYVGCTSDPFNRMTSHYRLPHWPLIAQMVMDVYPDQDSGLAEEARRIAKYRPAFNIAGTSRDPRIGPEKRARLAERELALAAEEQPA